MMTPLPFRPLLPAAALVWLACAAPALAQEGAFAIPATPPPVAGEAGTEAAAEDAATVAQQGERRLQMLEAQLHLLTGRYGEAREAYQRLRVATPESAEPLAGLGAVARETDRQRLARQMYRDAVLLDPIDASLTRALAALERDSGSRIRADVELRMQRGGLGTGKADIAVSEVGGHWNIGEGWRIGAIQGFAHVDAVQVLRADGAITDFSGDRIRTELFARYEWPEGTVVSASLYANEWSAGFGLLGRLPDDTGQTTLRVEYHRPIWDFVEAIIDGAVRDRVSVERFQRFSPRWTARLEVGANRYGIPRDDDDLVQSATVRGDIRLARVGDIEGLSIAYALDAEYVLSQNDPLNATGVPFQPLPVVDREVHAGLVAYAGSLGTIEGSGRFTYQGTVGYGVDRYGLSGPLAFGSVGYAVGGFEVAVRAGYVRNIGRSQGETTTLGIALAWVF